LELRTHNFLFIKPIIPEKEGGQQAMPQLTSGKGRAHGQLFDGRLNSFGDFGMGVFGRVELCPAIRAKMGCIRVR